VSSQVSPASHSGRCPSTASSATTPNATDGGHGAHVAQQDPAPEGAERPLPSGAPEVHDERGGGDGHGLDLGRETGERPQRHEQEEGGARGRQRDDDVAQDRHQGGRHRAGAAHEGDGGDEHREAEPQPRQRVGEQREPVQPRQEADQHGRGQQARQGGRRPVAQQLPQRRRYGGRARRGQPHERGV
jgi:hypothetical protein